MKATRYFYEKTFAGLLSCGKLSQPERSGLVLRKRSGGRRHQAAKDPPASCRCTLAAEWAPSSMSSGLPASSLGLGAWRSTDRRVLPQLAL